MKLLVKLGTTSKRIVIFVQDTSKTDGSGLTGLTSGSSGLTWYYWREDAGNAGGTSVSVTSATRGSFTSGGFIEIDATNLPGYYEIGVPNAVIASGANWAVMMLKGVTNMAVVPVEFQLVSFDPNDAVSLGLSSLPAGPTMVKKNQQLTAFMFVMVDGSGSPVTGLTITSTRSIDGAAFASTSNSATEVSSGWYKITLSAGDMNGNVIALRFAGGSALDTDVTLLTQP